MSTPNYVIELMPLDALIAHANMLQNERKQLKAELSAEKAKNRKVDIDIDAVVTRFLSWKLPEHFHPDAGISFAPKYNIGAPYERKHEPIGTNLLTADQAKEMFTYCLQPEFEGF